MSSGKKVNGFTIKYDKKSDSYQVRDRQGYTASSKSNIKLAVDWANKDRRYVSYKPSLGGGGSSKNVKKHISPKKKLSNKMLRLNKKLVK